MERKRYMQEVYQRFWLDARETKYANLRYDQSLFALLTKELPAGATVLDVACGTGYPFAQFLSTRGFAVHGIDIAPALIHRCRQSYPQVRCLCGDAERLPYRADAFDGVYCFHSTWYFPDLRKAILEMIRVALPGAPVLFDIQNRQNEKIRAAYERRVSQAPLSLRCKVRLRNLLMGMLRRDSRDYTGVVHEVPTWPEEVYDYLTQARVSGVTLLVKRPDDDQIVSDFGPLQAYSRLVFMVRK